VLRVLVSVQVLLLGHLQGFFYTFIFILCLRRVISENTVHWCVCVCVLCFI